MLSKLYLFYIKTLKFISSALLFLLVLVILLGVIFRFVFQSPLSWSEELGRYFFIWIIFLGSTLGFLSKSHLGIDIIVKSIPWKFQRIVVILGLLIVLLFLGIVIYYGCILAKMNMNQPSPAMRIPIGYAYAALPVGGLLMSIEVIRMIIQLLKGNRT